MNLLLVLLIIFFAIVLAILIICLYIGHKLKKNVGSYKLNQLFSAIRDQDSIIKQELSRPKSISGMTNLILPRIKEDFSDFDFQILCNKIESDLSNIFDCFEKKIHTNSQELSMIKEVVDAKIDDLKDQMATVTYDDIVFHGHAIKTYERENGLATITTSTSLEYYYTDTRSSKKDRKYENIKRQTRYTCKYVYIYDYSKIKNMNKQRLFILNCPNCGAPLYDFLDGNCRYCMSQIGQEKLKVWRISSFKEDYQNKFI